jgi:mRNA interferase MazF
VKLERGTLVLVELDATVGHEQRGVRPCIAVSDPEVNADQRFPLLAVVPVTRTPGEGALYPALQPGQSGLTKTSYALIDHLRSIDKRRIRRVFGLLAKDELAAVDQGLQLFLGLAGVREKLPHPWPLSQRPPSLHEGSAAKRAALLSEAPSKRVHLLRPARHTACFARR